MQNKLLKLGLVSLLLYQFTASGQPNAYKSKPTPLNFLISKYTGSQFIERVGYDEKKDVYTILPKTEDPKKLHFLDVPYAVTIHTMQHVDEVLTKNGQYAKVITYLNEVSLADKLPNPVKYRVFINDKLVALSENMEELAVTEHTPEFTAILKEKARDMQHNGIFKSTVFNEIGISEQARFTTQGYMIKMKGDEYRFSKEGNYFVFNPVKLYHGQLQDEGRGKVYRYHFFKKADAGYIVPDYTHVNYADTLPTGMAVRKSAYTYTLNFTLEGERYKDIEAYTLKTQNYIKVAPNPAKTTITCEVVLANSNGEKTMDYQVIDASGRVLITRKGLIENRVFEINIEQLPAAVYILKATNGKQTLQTKFIKID